METRSDRVVSARTVHPGEILREELKERGIKQKELAQMMGMQASHLNALINGKRNLNEDVAIRLERALGIPYKVWMDLHVGYLYEIKAIKSNTRATDYSSKDSEVFCIGQTLKEERLRAGLTQEELAQKIGTEPDCISLLESGKSDVQLSTLFKIFAGLGKRIKLTVL